MLVNNSTPLPGLGLSKVQVVDAIEIHVLCVPGEAGLPHAEVQVGCVHPLDRNTTVLFNHIQDGVEVADVPLLYTLQERRREERGGERGSEVIERW